MSRKSTISKNKYHKYQQVPSTTSTKKYQKIEMSKHDKNSKSNNKYFKYQKVLQVPKKYENINSPKPSFTLTMLRRFLQPHPVAGLVILIFLLQPFFVFAVSPKLLNRLLSNLNHIYNYRGSRSERSIFQIFQIVFQIQALKVSNFPHKKCIRTIFKIRYL